MKALTNILLSVLLIFCIAGAVIEEQTGLRFISILLTIIIIIALYGNNDGQGKLQSI